MTSQATNRREGGSTSWPGCSRKLRTYTLKELETVWAAPELLCVPTIGGGSAQSGDGDGGGHRSQISLPSWPKYTKTAKKTGGFAHVLAYKSPKTPFCTQKYLTRYTHETFFEEYMNFKTHYLSHCRVISLQSFGSHTYMPQPHGLGLSSQPGQNADSLHVSCLIFNWMTEYFANDEYNPSPDKVCCAKKL
jgi:hypothetical protein